METFDLARRTFDAHVSRHPMNNYPAILSLHGLARLAEVSGDKNIVMKCRRHLLSFLRGEVDMRSNNFENYRCGGNGTAFMFWKGHLSEAQDPVLEHAQKLMKKAPRSDEGIFCMPGGPHQGGIWIDVAFAVTPFLLFAGLAHGREDWIDEACSQVLDMTDILRNGKTGLLHQCREFRGPGLLSKDHWSRGNGWALLALADLVNYLPANHPRRREVESCFTHLLGACLERQDDEGLWHQELTMPESYVETSGSGLILYALGVALECDLGTPTGEDKLLMGLQGYLNYFTQGGDVFHTCCGCLCPGKGRKLDYAAQSPVRNDPHAYGPIILAFGQAHNLGISTVEST